jgi:hypothetical protein
VPSKSRGTYEQHIERQGQRVLAWMALSAALVLALWMFGH